MSDLANIQFKLLFLFIFALNWEILMREKYGVYNTNCINEIYLKSQIIQSSYLKQLKPIGI
jgi:hypothetical protein